MNFFLFNAIFKVDEDCVPNEEDRKRLCLKVPCRVELGHSNVCFGVEKSWPKRIFKDGKEDFKSLNQREKDKIYAHMEKKATKLHEIYVSKERLEKRRQSRSNRALFPFYEEIYRRNLYMRLEALSETTTTDTDEFTDADDEESVNDVSMQTVINTGSSRAETAESQKEVTDFNDNDVDIIQIDETEDDIVDDDRFCDSMSESVTTRSSVNNPAESERELACATPNLGTQDLDMRTPQISHIQGRYLAEGSFGSDDDDGTSPEIDSLDFMSQCMEAITSTQ